MSEKNLPSLVKQAGWSFSGKVFSQAFQLVSGILMANFLGSFMLGLYQLGIRTNFLLANITKLGLDKGLLKYIPVSMRKGKQEVKKLITYILKTGFLSSLIVGAMLFFSSRYIAHNIFNEPDLDGVLKIFSFLLPLSTLNFLLLFANRGAKQVKYNVLFKNIVYSVLFCAIITISYIAGLSFHTLLILIVILEGIILGALFWSIRKTFDFEIDVKDLFKTDTADLVITKKELFSFSTPLLFQGLIFYLMGTVDIFMIAYFLDAKYVGIYSVALRISLLISFVLYSFNDIFMPVISEKFMVKDFVGIKYIYQTETKWIFSVSLLFVGLIYLLHNDILMLFGHEYLPAEIPLKLLCVGQLVNASVGGVGVLLETMEHQRLVLLNVIILLFLSITLNYLFVGYLELGIVGAATANTISVVFINIVRLLELKILRDIQPFNVNFLRVIVSFIPAYIIAHIFMNMLDTWFVWRLVAGSLTLMFINVILYYFIGKTKEDQVILDKINEKIRN